MCQIFIINKKSFQSDTEVYQDHLESGAALNDHGCSALFIDDEGNHSIIRSMKFDTIMDMMLINERWERVVIHQRYTTQGEANLSNTHLWQVGNYFYCHNGVLRDPECDRFDVDSQLIGHYLETNPWEAIAYCQGEDYANTFIVGLEEKKIWVTRSVTNTLFTDGNGQYSTRKLEGRIDQEMSTNSVEIIDLDIQSFDKWGYGGNYEDYKGFSTGTSYEDKVAAATHGSDIPSDDTEPGSGFTSYTLDDIESEIESNGTASLEDVVEIEQALHDAIANEDQILERKYSYLLERANGNG